MSRRLLLGAFGDPGHAFPMIALGAALSRRGHEVTLQTWERWRGDVEGQGMRFAKAPEFRVCETGKGWEPLGIYEAAVHATDEIRPLIGDLRPQAIVADILTLGPALGAELEGVPWATLIPHLNPQAEAGFPVFSIGARLPRTGLGRALWRRAGRPVELGLERGRMELNETRAKVGLEPVQRFYGGLSQKLVMVGTFPQLEYPRRWPAGTHVVGPLIWEPPAADVRVPPGEGPLVLVAPSTAQDPEHQMLRAALEGLAQEPLRVLATWNRRLPGRPLRVGENTVVVDWLSYARTMPLSDVVVCHAGHGTLARALQCGRPVVACPAAGDMNETAARVDWAGVGVRLPRRFIGPRALRLAVARVLGDPSFAARARELQRWAAEHDGAQRAADLVEELAGG